MATLDQIYLGIDYGERRLGISVSDASATIAGERRTVQVTSAQDAAQKIAEEISEIQPIGIVVGYPLAPDEGSRGERCRMVDRFIAALASRTELPIYRQDERESSSEARKMIHRSGKRVTRKTRLSGKIDQIAAVFILQRWLDENKDR